MFISHHKVRWPGWLVWLGAFVRSGSRQEARLAVQQYRRQQRHQRKQAQRLAGGRALGDASRRNWRL